MIPRIKNYGPFLVFFAAMLWATDAPFRVYLIKSLSSNFIVLAEHLIDVIVCLPILVMGLPQLRRLGRNEWLAVLLIGVGGSALASVAFTQAFHYVNPSVAILLQKLQPLAAIGLAALILKERLTPNFWKWAAAALFGAYLVSFPGIIPQLYPGEAWKLNLLGVALALFAALLWGASTVMGRVVLAKVDFKLMTALRFATAFVFLIFLNLWQNTIPPLSAVSRTDWFFIGIIAITSGVVSLFIYYKGLAQTEASVATLAELGFPMAAVVVNWIFLNAALAPMQIVGMGVLLFAIFRLAKENEAHARVLKHA